MTLTAIGVAIGLIASFALTRLMKTLLFGVSATDAMTFVLVPLLLTVVALEESICVRTSQTGRHAGAGRSGVELDRGRIGETVPQQCRYENPGKD
jgi:hypothetical protein